MAKNDKEHYVPKRYLRYFATDINNPTKICKYDKKLMKPFPFQPIRDVAEEKCFYDIKFQNNIYNIDEKFIELHLSRTIEITFSKILSKINSKNINYL